MPYFRCKTDETNILFIHIPKTGGTSIEKYFSEKLNIALNKNALFGFLPDNIKKQNNISIKACLHHLTYNRIMEFKTFFNIDINNLSVIAVVRNPYARIISDLFFWSRMNIPNLKKINVNFKSVDELKQKININSSKEEIYRAIQEYLKGWFDNHNIKQSAFITDHNGKLIENIKILKTEHLTEDMINLGYSDFNKMENVNSHKIDYKDYLDSDSIRLINEYYSTDFELLGYEKMPC